jgi:hypothetical protein
VTGRWRGHGSHARCDSAPNISARVWGHQLLCSPGHIGPPSSANGPGSARRWRSPSSTPDICAGLRRTASSPGRRVRPSETGEPHPKRLSHEGRPLGHAPDQRPALWPAFCKAVQRTDQRRPRFATLERARNSAELVTIIEDLPDNYEMDRNPLRQQARLVAGKTPWR